jgi:hypothetical protein
LRPVHPAPIRRPDREEGIMARTHARATASIAVTFALLLGAILIERRPQRRQTFRTTSDLEDDQD